MTSRTHYGGPRRGEAVGETLDCLGEKGGLERRIFSGEAKKASRSKGDEKKMA